MYNLNPHFAFRGFHVYLHPDVGQRNINCDPALSGFDELVIQVLGDGPTDYFHARKRRGELLASPEVEPYFERMLAELD